MSADNRQSYTKSSTRTRISTNDPPQQNRDADSPILVDSDHDDDDISSSETGDDDDYEDEEGVDSQTG